ncbi:MAG: hypothetical protein EKK40_08065 [Bradyrhizobiaceae bacterium]|nr:MAG: hypothetical protein EKK40_08065 [Bradyrhizobiaceae bacterium]
MKSNQDGLTASSGQNAVQPIKRRTMLRLNASPALSIVPSATSPLMKLGAEFDNKLNEYECERQRWIQLRQQVDDALDASRPIELQWKKGDLLMVQVAEIEVHEPIVEGDDIDLFIVSSLEHRANLRLMNNEMRARRTEIIKARDWWLKEEGRIARRLKWKSELEDKNVNRLVSEADRIVARAQKLKASNLEELAIKARMAEWMVQSGNAAKAAESTDPTERIIWSIARDLLAMPKVNSQHESEAALCANL